MHLKGIAAILLVIPVAIITLLSITATIVKSHREKTRHLPSTISRSQQAKSLPQSSPSQAANKESPTPTSEPSPTQEYVTIAKEAPSPSPAPQPKASSGSTTTGVNYTVATFNLSSVTVVTDSAYDDDCSNNCPAKTLASYVAENGGRAGINGTYFCPPDYSWCSDKVNTYDFPIWNNRKKKWMRADTLFWNDRGMFVFRPGSAQFFSCAACSGVPSDITGGIVNYPSLLSGGKTVFDEGSLPDKVRNKGTKGGIGTGNGKIFLVNARDVTISEFAQIFLSLGATDALNLDGGGSSALFDGGYRVGPGRNLPNALIVK